MAIVRVAGAVLLLIQSALDQFGKVVNFSGGDLEATYKKLNGELESSEERAETVLKRISEVESVGDALQ